MKVKKRKNLTTLEKERIEDSVKFHSSWLRKELTEFVLSLPDPLLSDQLISTDVSMAMGIITRAEYLSDPDSYGVLLYDRESK